MREENTGRPRGNIPAQISKVKSRKKNESFTEISSEKESLRLSEHRAHSSTGILFIGRFFFLAVDLLARVSCLQFVCDNSVCVEVANVQPKEPIQKIKKPLWLWMKKIKKD